MQIAKDTVVQFHYVLKTEDGTEVEKSAGGDPVSYLHGHGNILPGLEAQLSGASEGDCLSVELSAENAYGRRQENAVQRVPIKHLQHTGKLRVGTIATVQTDNGARQVTVVKVGKFNADVDSNHPLAGHNLCFDIEITAVRQATAEELAHGHAHGPGGHHH